MSHLQRASHTSRYSRELGVTSSVTRSAPRGSVSRQPVAALSVTPAIVAEPNDLFEDVTEKAGIRFVNQFCDSKIANIIESNGAGACWLDYDGDGLMDLYLVNPGPLEGVTHQAPGTVRRPNALYRKLSQKLHEKHQP